MVIVRLHGSLLESSSSNCGVLQVKRLLDVSCRIMRVVLDRPVTVTSIVSRFGAPVCSILRIYKSISNTFFPLLLLWNHK